MNYLEKITALENELKQIRAQKNIFDKRNEI